MRSKAAYEKMDGVRSPQFDGMPRTRNPHAVEDRMIKGIEEIDVLKERYRQAVEYMAWFRPAWEELTADEQYVLETFYGGGNEYGSSAIYKITDHFLSSRVLPTTKEPGAVSSDRPTVRKRIMSNIV